MLFCGKRGKWQKLVNKTLIFLLSILVSTKKLVANDSPDDDSDVDGVPLGLDSHSSSKKSNNTKKLPSGFVPSKWETVDPEEVQAQAVTSKWDIFDQDDVKNDDDDEDIDGVPMDSFDSKVDESMRQRLRDIEMKVMSYQDELECGKETIKPGWTISQMVMRLNFYYF